MINKSVLHRVNPCTAHVLQVPLWVRRMGGMAVVKVPYVRPTLHLVLLLQERLYLCMKGMPGVVCKSFNEALLGEARS